MRHAVTVHMAAPPEAIWPLPLYWTTCEVLACEPEQEFAFAVLTGGRPVNTWRYRLERAGHGTDITESFELADTAALRLYWRLLGWARGRTNRQDMRTTLERVKAEAEASASS